MLIGTWQLLRLQIVSTPSASRSMVMAEDFDDSSGDATDDALDGQISVLTSRATRDASVEAARGV